MCTGTASSGTLKGSSRGRSIEIVPESSRTTAVPPQYRIYDIGVVQGGDTASQGFGVSTGGAAVGRSVRSGGAQAFTWTSGGGIVGLPNLSGRAFCVSNGANNNDIVAGTCASTLFGSSRLPVIWQNGAVSQLPLPSGETLGDANDVNASGVAVGSRHDADGQFRLLRFSGVAAGTDLYRLGHDQALCVCPADADDYAPSRRRRF